jgi:hypothetical protein
MRGLSNILTKKGRKIPRYPNRNPPKYHNIRPGLPVW